jgi:hypothetical protein
MKLLFVVSGNVKPFTITPFIQAQGEALIEKGIQLSYFRIEGGGLKITSNIFITCENMLRIIGWI